MVTPNGTRKKLAGIGFAIAPDGNTGYPLNQRNPMTAMLIESPAPDFEAAMARVRIALVFNISRPPARDPARLLWRPGVQRLPSRVTGFHRPLFAPYHWRHALGSCGSVWPVMSRSA